MMWTIRDTEPRMRSSRLAISSSPAMRAALRRAVDHGERRPELVAGHRDEAALGGGGLALRDEGAPQRSLALLQLLEQPVLLGDVAVGGDGAAIARRGLGDGEHAAIRVGDRPLARAHAVEPDPLRDRRLGRQPGLPALGMGRGDGGAADIRERGPGHEVVRHARMELHVALVPGDEPVMRVPEREAVAHRGDAVAEARFADQQVAPRGVEAAAAARGLRLGPGAPPQQAAMHGQRQRDRGDGKREMEHEPVVGLLEPGREQPVHRHGDDGVDAALADRPVDDEPPRAVEHGAHLQDLSVDAPLDQALGPWRERLEVRARWPRMVEQQLAVVAHEQQRRALHVGDVDVERQEPLGRDVELEDPDDAAVGPAHACGDGEAAIGLAVRGGDDEVGRAIGHVPRQGFAARDAGGRPRRGLASRGEQRTLVVVDGEAGRQPAPGPLGAGDAFLEFVARGAEQFGRRAEMFADASQLQAGRREDEVRMAGDRARQGLRARRLLAQVVVPRPAHEKGEEDAGDDRRRQARRQQNAGSGLLAFHPPPPWPAPFPRGAPAGG
jgi:hypothetical protein